MTFTLIAKKRTEKADEVRARGMIPGVIYGARMTPVSIALDGVRFEKLYKEAGESTLIDFSIDGGSEASKVLVQDIQYDPVKRNIIHVDLRQINMSEEMHTNIPLAFTGESPAVKSLGGTLITSHDELEVKCLPKDLVAHIEVSLARLATFDEAIHVKDIPAPPGITILDDPETLIAKVTPPLTEEQIKAMEEQGPKSVEDVEVAEKKKEDEGEGEDEGDAEKAKKE